VCDAAHLQWLCKVSKYVGDGYCEMQHTSNGCEKLVNT